MAIFLGPQENPQQCICDTLTSPHLTSLCPHCLSSQATSTFCPQQIMGCQLSVHLSIPAKCQNRNWGDIQQEERNRWNFQMSGAVLAEVGCRICSVFPGLTMTLHTPTNRKV